MHSLSYFIFGVFREFGHVSVDKHFTNPHVLKVFTDCNRMSCHAVYIKYERLCKNLGNWYILNDFTGIMMLAEMKQESIPVGCVPPAC